MSDHGPQPRPGGGADPRPADAVVPQHVVVPAAHASRRRCARSTGPATVRAGRPPRARRRGTCTPTDDAELLFCDNESNARAPVGRRRVAAVPEGRHQRPRRARHADGQPRRRGHQGRRPRPPRRPGRRIGVDVGAPDPRRPARRRIRSPTPTTSCRRALAPRPTSSTPPSRPTRVSADAASVMRQALAGMLWSKQSYYFDVDVWLREHQAHPLRQPEQRRRPQRVVVPHDQPRRHLDARHVGVPVVRGVGPGVPLRPAGDGRPGLRQVAARPDAVAGVPAPDRADPGLRVELRRRQPAGARLRHAVHAQRRRATSAPSTCRSCASRSRGCCSTSRGGSTARTRRARTCSRAASSASTTSACSTAARRCPTGGRLEQADGTAWMALFSQNMLELALDLPSDDPDYDGLRAQVRRALLLDRRRRRPDRRPPRRDVGRGGRLLLRRAAPARRHGRAAQGALARRPAAAVRDHRDLGDGARGAPGADGAASGRTSTATATCWPTSPTRRSPA